MGALTANKPVKKVGVLLFLLVTAFTSAHNHKLTAIREPKPKNPRVGYIINSSRLLKNEARASLLIANNPPDQTIYVCNSSSKTLTISPGDIPNGYSLPASWDDGSTGNSRTVTQSGDYFWQVTGPTIVKNGDFENTQRQFTSDYTYIRANSTCTNCCCGVLSSEGTYSITTNPNNVHNNFTPFTDHTSQSGNMLVVNGASTANKAVWTENITNIIPNTDYVFSAWATSANPTAPAILNFSIDGSPLGTISLSPTLADGIWQPFSAIWHSGSATTATIALVNQNTAADGNDFALDDIVFAPVYRQTIHVVFDSPVLTLTQNNVCGPGDLTSFISGYDASTYNYFIKDSANQTTQLSNGQLTSTPGTYDIWEVNKTSGCQSPTKQFTIYPIPQKPGITSM